MSAPKINKKVAIFQNRLVHYRVELFDRLHQICLENGIELHLIHGLPSEMEKTRNDVGELPWSSGIDSKFFKVGGVYLIWQPSPLNIVDMDLLILTQENRILSNYLLILKAKIKPQKVAFWGHGANFQSDAPEGLREKWKKLWLNSVDWWFSYTDLTTNLLIKEGFPTERITTLDNAVNTEDFRKQVAQFSASKVRKLQLFYGIEENDKVAVYCGSLYPDKKIDLLIESSDIVKKIVPDFQLLVIGDGPCAKELHDAAKTRPWIHNLGVLKGSDKAACFRLADIMVNPGSLGLHILDSFSIGMPLVSTENSKHGPEIVYTENGVNSILVESDHAEEYASAVVRLFNDQPHYQSIAEHAAADGKKYTLDKMVERFYDGLVQCFAS